MIENSNKWLYWTPRVLAIIFSGFISVFALDVFVEGYSFLDTLWALLMHLIPTFLVLIVLVIAWRWERLGGFLFVVLGSTYIILVYPHIEWVAIILISGPLFLIGGLFLLCSCAKQS